MIALHHLMEVAGAAKPALQYELYDRYYEQRGGERAVKGDNENK